MQRGKGEKGFGEDFSTSSLSLRPSRPLRVDAVEETAEIKGTKITRVRVASGTFNSGMPGGPTTPQTDYGLYGAILENKDGDVFIKLTGPAALVKASAADFEALIQSPF